MHRRLRRRWFSDPVRKSITEMGHMLHRVDRTVFNLWLYRNTVCSRARICCHYLYVGRRIRHVNRSFEER